MPPTPGEGGGCAGEGAAREASDRRFRTRREQARKKEKEVERWKTNSHSDGASV